MDTLTLVPALPSEPDVQALLQTHHALMRSQSPADSCHVLDPLELSAAGAFVLAARRQGTILGIGALAPFASQQGELKSMHTAAAARGQGVGRAILEALIAKAKGDGLTHLWLETGSADAFAPARALYTNHGFALCAPFGTYTADPLSVFMTRTL
ncbi:MAG: GNAT family N-acetyltransferase [Pseudomonadota bacterium]